MAAFDIENGTPVINARVEQIRAALTPAGQFGQISEQAYLIKKWLDRDATSLVFGASNTGKSFFALDLAIHVAAGNSWQCCRVTQGHVIYVAAEGGLGFSKRIRVISQALPELFAQAQEQFCHLPLQLDLHGAQDADALLTAIGDRPVDMLIIDTLAMSFGAGNENEGKDVTQFLTHIAQIRDQLKCHVMLVHHSGKDQGRGARGHSSLRAAVDTEIELTVDGLVRAAKATKQRDLEGGKVVAFTLEAIQLAEDMDGDPITSCIVKPQDASYAKTIKRRRLTGLTEIAHQALVDAVRDTGVKVQGNPDLPAGRKVVYLAEWRIQYSRKREVDHVQKASISKDFERQVAKLIDLNYVRKEGDRVWLVERT